MAMALPPSAGRVPCGLSRMYAATLGPILESGVCQAVVNGAMRAARYQFLLPYRFADASPNVVGSCNARASSPKTSSLLYGFSLDARSL
jgi:hypothetical protein